MRAPSFGVIGFGAVAGVGLLLLALGAPGERGRASVAPAAPLPASVKGDGVTLASAAIELPDDEPVYPAGPHAELMNAHCAACHSPSMALGQPPLLADQWRAEVTKMREAYHAPVPDGAVGGIVAYLLAMPGQHAAPPTGRAQDPAPAARPRVSS